jgi:hypothetical protein
MENLSNDRAFIALTIVPIAMVAAKMYVPVWALIAGHCGMLVVGIICGEWSREAV